MGTRTTFQGGTIEAPNGLFIQGANSLEGNGVVDGRISASFGSTIIATGNLTSGDSTSHEGFASDGELYVNEHIVTINDANEALIGLLTELGNNGGPGTLAAANGAVVEFGKHIIGHGTVETPNDPARPVINNGSISGNSPAEPITLVGFVKGVGTMDHVLITGTDTPGLSTAPVKQGSVTYDGTLRIEIGGTTPGSGYDQINHILGAVVADLGGGVRHGSRAGDDGSYPSRADGYFFVDAERPEGALAHRCNGFKGGARVVPPPSSAR